MQHDYDLLIAGGGLAGNCLALALKETGLKIAIVEASTREQHHDSPAGDRALALAAGTVKMLESLGIWQGISQAATAIKTSIFPIKAISAKSGFRRTKKMWRRWATSLPRGILKRMSQGLLPSPI